MSNISVRPSIMLKDLACMMLAVFALSANSFIPHPWWWISQVAAGGYIGWKLVDASLWKELQTSIAENKTNKQNTF